MTRLRLLIATFAILSILLTSIAPSALAQATDTPTPRPTMTASPTSTPWPTATPGATPTPRAVAAQEFYGPIPRWWPPADPTTNIKKELQGAIDVVSNTIGIINDITKDIVTSVKNSPMVTSIYSAFKLYRGFTILLSDFEWIGILAGWFTLAAFVIFAVMVIRLIVSVWGIVERVISVIKLIPFI